MAANHPLALQATNAWTPVPNDTILLKDAVSTPARDNGIKYEFCSLYSGAGGDISVTMVDDTNVTFVGVPAGIFMPIVIKRVRATGTSATGLLALVGRFG